MKIQFIGAAHEVTGSCTLLEVSGRYYLVDCGMEQGIDVFQNVDLPVPAREIEAVFLTHAHIDHSGMIPRLYKDGFRGIVFATNATCDLCGIMLKDSAHIQMEEAQWRNRKAERSGDVPMEPTYDLEDAIGALSLFRPCNYGETIPAAAGIDLRFTDVGHLLGSACVELTLREGDVTRKIVFSGDVGNLNQPIIRNPQYVKDTDYLVLESTYGNREHEPVGDVVRELADCIARTLRRGGNVVIPSFAVGRTQELLYAIREIKEKRMVPDTSFPVYVDSPLAIEATQIFQKCDRACFDDETLSLLARGINPLSFDGLHIALTPDDSRRINEDPHPKVILSASGMCEAGRVRHHLKHNLWGANNTILFVGYQAEGSLGRALQDGARNVRLFKEDIAVRAEIRSLRGLSGHADKNGLIAFLKGFEKKPHTVFVNHGNESSAEDFKKTLEELGYRTEAPYSGTEYDLVTGAMTAFTETRRITRAERSAKESNRKKSVHRELVAAAEALLALVKRCEARSNKDNAKFTAQIRSLIERWR